MANQDLTTFTEVDADAELTITADRVTWADVRRDSDTYLYKDFGAGAFSGDFTHKLDCQSTTSVYAFNAVSVWTLSNTVESQYYTTDHLRLEINQAGDLNTLELKLSEKDGGSSYSDTYLISDDTTYYLTITRDESVTTYGTIYCYIYSDSARTTLLDTLSIALHTSKKDYRYFYAFNAINTADAASTRILDGWAENYDFPIITSVSTDDTIPVAENPWNITGSGFGDQ